MAFFLFVLGVYLKIFARFAMIPYYFRFNDCNILLFYVTLFYNNNMFYIRIYNKYTTYIYEWTDNKKGLCWCFSIYAIYDQIITKAKIKHFKLLCIDLVDFIVLFMYIFLYQYNRKFCTNICIMWFFCMRYIVLVYKLAFSSR